MIASPPRTTRISAGVGGWLALLLVVIGVSCPPAIAAPSRSATRPTVVADSGFRPRASGFSFANYGTRAGIPNLGSDELRQLFGDGVCAGFSGGACVLSPPALAWMQQENAAMADGHCVGLSITALFFYSDLTTPLWFGSGAVPRLTITHNQLLAREIAYGYVFQVLDSVRRAEVSGSPREVVSKLVGALRTGGQLYTLGITKSDGSGGHAVTPYEVDRLGPNHYAIRIYDNNFPRTTRVVQVNTKSDSWSYRAALSPNQPGSLYTGNATTHSLFLMPTAPGLGVQPCPFCSAGPAGSSTAAPASGAAGTAAAARADVGAGYEAIRLQTTGRVAGHLLITDPRGRRVGFLHGRLVDQIPGARVISLFVGGTRTWLNHTEPEYELPTGRRYKIELTAQATAGAPRGKPVAQRSHASVTVLEPGFLAAVRRIDTRPGQKDQLNLTAGGHAISFRPQAARSAPELVLGNAAAGTDDHQWNITDLGTPSHRQVSASLNVAHHTMSLVGAANYDLSMDMVGNGVSVFAHHGFAIGVGITATFDYTNWKAGDGMPVTETRHGVVVRREILSDEPDPSRTGTAFEPSEPTPAPAEPQPHPAPAGATATTLVCSPPSVPVGGATTCHVDVSNLDSYAAGTPGGEVFLSSDNGGAFSGDICMLSAGSCEITYTPAALGSGVHDLTAVYAGDNRFHPSKTVTAVQVTPPLQGTLPGGGGPPPVPVVTYASHTSLQCAPPEIPVDSPTTCTATVTDNGSGPPIVPTGQIEFSSDNGGSFSASPCTLSGGSCQVTYVPNAVGSGTHGLTASYTGDDTSSPSAGLAAVKVLLRPTHTSLTCKPTLVYVNEPATCTATVTDTGPGITGAPTGTITFYSADTPGTFHGNPCTLSALSTATATATCVVTYTPSACPKTDADVYASYSGDASHATNPPARFDLAVCHAISRARPDRATILVAPSHAQTARREAIRRARPGVR